MATGIAPDDNARASMVRIEALRAARERGLLPPVLAGTLLRQETGQLRMQYFQSRLRTGRVRIPWDEIERSMRELSETEITTLRLLRILRPRQEGGGAGLASRLAGMLADRIVDHVLYEAESSIDQALSNNLRHGIVVPRFLRAFDDAFQTASRRKGLPAWDDVTLGQVFGPCGPSLLALRDFVNDALKAFVDEKLTVTRGGPFEVELRRKLVERIEGHALAGTGRTRADRLERIVSTVARRRL